MFIRHVKPMISDPISREIIRKDLCATITDMTHGPMPMGLHLSKSARDACTELLLKKLRSYCGELDPLNENK